MEPNSGSTTALLSSSAAAAAPDFPGGGTAAVALGPYSSRTTPSRHPEDPNLYTIPAALSAVYRPLPVLLRLSIAILSTLGAAATTVAEGRRLLTRPGVSWAFSVERMGSSALPIPWKSVVVAIAKAFVWYVAATVAIQDVMPRFRPSRVSTEELATRFNLPSPFSRYAPVEAGSHHRVHWLAFEASIIPSASNSNLFDVVYVNHGFGASSLSWLPAMPPLAQAFNCTVLGHDSPGFGFTDRLETNEYYSLQNSAAIGASLMHAQLGPHSGNKAALLLGHSMGSLTTLRMALRLDPTIQLHIILVAPALGFRPPGKQSLQRGPGKLSNLVQRSVGQPVVGLLTRVASYGLRRVVGRPNFWRAGLSAVWGDKSRLHESDVLRYQWPSIGRGWERGLLQFTRAQSSLHSSGYETDQELLRAVLDLPNVLSVNVILGSKDRVVSEGRVLAFLQEFPEVNIKKMVGSGHDPFEEDTDSFVDIVESLLEC